MFLTITECKRANRCIVGVERDANRDEAGGGGVGGGREAFLLSCQLLLERVYVAGGGLAEERPAGEHAVLRELVALGRGHLFVLLDAVATQLQKLANHCHQITRAQRTVDKLVAIYRTHRSQKFE